MNMSNVLWLKNFSQVLNWDFLVKTLESQLKISINTRGFTT